MVYDYFWSNNPGSRSIQTSSESVYFLQNQPYYETLAMDQDLKQASDVWCAWGDTFLEEPLFLLAVVQRDEEEDEEGGSADQQRSANSLSKHQDD